MGRDRGGNHLHQEILVPIDFIFLYFSFIDDEYIGDGGSYPECHVAQYPLEMGRKKVRK